MPDAPTRLRFISIVSVPVTDPEAAKRFYIDTVGFELLRDDPIGPEQRWIQLRPPGAETSIALVTWFETMRPGSLTGLVLESADLAADYRVLEGRGLELSEPTDAPWGRFATFRDPDGNGWVVQQSAEAT